MKQASFIEKRSVSESETTSSGFSWDPNEKEPWHLEFEREPVNEEKWSCIVIAAFPAETQDDECIQNYCQSVGTGLRKAVKTLSINDVITLLKDFQEGQKKPRETLKSWAQISQKSQKFQKKEDSATYLMHSDSILNLAVTHAKLTNSECKLPSDLMAALIKILVLNLKKENCFEKMVDAVKERKLRERDLKAKFIRGLKPFGAIYRKESYKETASIQMDLEAPINDEPIGGPDLYILLTDFYDAFCFSELTRMNVPLLAFLKISMLRDAGFGKWSAQSMSVKGDSGKKGAQIAEFWETLQENCAASEKTHFFKDIAMLEYQVPFSKHFGSKQKFVEEKTRLRTIFDEITWMLYSAYFVYRHHQSYLQQVYVQNLNQSLQPLNLDDCKIYAKLLDALVTGEPLTYFLVLYAMVEQVVAGVPETENVTIKYEPNFNNFFPIGSPSISTRTSKTEEENNEELVTPCTDCRDKKVEDICVMGDKPKEPSETSHRSSVEYQDADPVQEISEFSISEKIPPPEHLISESLLDLVLAEKKTEKEIQSDRKWKPPKLCLYGDSLFLQTYHCDPRIFSKNFIVERFLRSSSVPRIWIKYPPLPPPKKAFYNFHLQSFRKISKESEQSLKLKISFAISMKLIGIAKLLYLYKDENQKASDLVFSTEKDKMNKLSRVKFDRTSRNLKDPQKTFSSHYFRKMKSNTHFRLFAANSFKGKSPEMKVGSKLKATTTLSLQKVEAHYNIFTLVTHRSSGSYFPFSLRRESPNSVQIMNGNVTLGALFSLLDCCDISNINEPQLLNEKESESCQIENYKFYERLEPHLMVQRLMEVQSDYNTIQYLYFAPTDCIIVIMCNDFDNHGIFYSSGCGVLPTPVSLRDFYSYVYPEINTWLVKEEETYRRFALETQERIEEEIRKKDEEYMIQLKRKYCEMSEESRREFLETEVDWESDPKVRMEELESLPMKPILPQSNDAMFIVTNFSDLRTQTTRNVHEFHSKDGTEVNVVTDAWLYESSILLTLGIKKHKLKFFYYQTVDEKDYNTKFSVITHSEIIFVFDKDPETGIYNIDVSWPIGLLIKPLQNKFGTYIRQSYMKVYRRGWDIAEEKSRCYLKNGQIIIFKENGEICILHGSGTKCTTHRSENVYEVVSSGGEVWQVSLRKGKCPPRKKLLKTYRVFQGQDCTTLETFYKREDGVMCMLWPNGCLVTTYPDGTKITSMPSIDKEETSIEWSEEEKLRFLELDSREMWLEESSQGSLTVNLESEKFFNVEGFVVVTCSYLMEHPKYARVRFDSETSDMRVTMPEEFHLDLNSDGRFRIQHENVFLEVEGSTIEFYTTCENCSERSVATINLTSMDVLCKLIDFFQKAFFVFQDGKTMCSDYNRKTGGSDEMDSDIETAKENEVNNRCTNNHEFGCIEKHRCFACDRDLGGVEFIQVNNLACYCYKLPENTHYDLHGNDPNEITHTFLSSHNKIGYENWMMGYHNKENSVPTNLKKKDLKEVGVKDISSKLFRYPFPKHHNCQPKTEKKVEHNLVVPKVTVGRIIKCLSPEPVSVIKDLQNNIVTYQKRARDICSAYKKQMMIDPMTDDQRTVNMRLSKIAFTLSQNMHAYPHLRTQFPSTEQEIHCFGHFINAMEEFKSHTMEDSLLLPDCKQLPRRLPRTCDFPSIHEEHDEQ